MQSRFVDAMLDEARLRKQGIRRAPNRPKKKAGEKAKLGIERNPASAKPESNPGRAKNPNIDPETMKMADRWIRFCRQYTTGARLRLLKKTIKRSLGLSPADFEKQVVPRIRRMVRRMQ